MRLHIFKCITFVGILGTSVVSNANIPSPIVCLNRQCLPANQAVTKEHLLEHVNHLLKVSTNSPISICEADPVSKNCLKKGITIPLQISTSNINLDILSAKLTDVKDIPGTAGIDMIVDYQTKAGNIFPTCQTAFSRLGIFDNNAIQIIAPDFSCYLTQTMPVSFSLSQYVDYINFDDGLLGIYYTIGSHVGNKNGYAILKFQNLEPFKSHPQFPMPSVVEKFSTEKTQPAHTHMTPVWMKPTPFLTLEKPSFVDQDCMHTPQGCENLILNMNNNSTSTLPTPAEGVPSTTGLIEQDKIVLPPLKGVRKTVTTRKQVFEDGKPVSVEEEVVQYEQEDPSQPFVKVEDTATPQEQNINELPTPEMPSIAHGIQQNQSGLQNIDVVVPHEVILNPNEIQQPVQQEVKPLQNENLVIIQDKSIPKEDNTSLIDSLEKYFYF